MLIDFCQIFCETSRNLELASAQNWCVSFWESIHSGSVWHFLDACRFPFSVAGEDFGCGSSRERAVWAIRGAGVRTVIPKSFARIFYRNAINCGFYIIESPDAVEKISDGDELEIDYKAGLIKNKTASTDIRFNPLADFASEIISNGGLLEHITKGTTD